MFDKPILINGHPNVEKAYTSSIAYLSENPEILQQVAAHLWAYYELGDLVPQTVENFSSGHYFPHTESYYELEASYEFALQGYYKYAFIALRTVLELGLLGVYFSVNDKEHIEIRPWISSEEKTPWRDTIFKRLLELPNFVIFNQRFQLQNRIRNTFDLLDGFTHTRGYKFSSRKLLNHANFNQFVSKSLESYCHSMFSVVRDIVIVLLLKYPIGMQGLPLDEKFGMEGPTGGLLQPHQVQFITSIIPSDEREFLQKISDENSDVQQTKKYLNNLPDLTSEEWKEQLKRWDEFMKDHTISPDEDAG